MGLINEFKNQINGENNNDEVNLPWDVAKQNGEDSLVTKLGTKKIATIGMAILIVIIIVFAIFNLFSNNTAISIEKSDTGTSEHDVTLVQIQVHVAGEVNKPGVYKLDEGSRIMDAINIAGGFTSKANQSALNLAKVLEDGEQILIPSNEAQSQSENSTTSTNNNGKVNINTADLAQLQTLPGVGQSTAQKIIDYRNSNGKFKTIEDLKKVSGIGDKTFDKFKDKICV